MNESKGQQKKSAEDFLKDNGVFENLDCNGWMLDGTIAAMEQYAAQERNDLLEALKKLNKAAIAFAGDYAVRDQTHIEVLERKLHNAIDLAKAAIKKAEE